MRTSRSNEDPAELRRAIPDAVLRTGMAVRDEYPTIDRDDQEVYDEDEDEDDDF